MPYPKEATVKNYNGIECWRTWFLEECEKANLFGVNEKYLPLINTEDCKPYHIGTLIYLEDAPYFKRTKCHRICGPYQIIESTPQDSYKTIREENNKIIIYKDLNPSNGPWFDSNSVTRIIEGIKFKHQQLASEFDYFPYRFSIKKSKNFKVFFISHSSFKCELCFQDE